MPIPRLTCLLAAFTACGATSGVWAAEFLQLGLALGQEDNVPRVLHRVEEAESALLSLDISGGEQFQLGLNQTLTLAAQLNVNRYFDLSGFDHFAAGLSAAYRYKFGLGAYAPQIGAVLSTATEQWDGEARDQRRVGLELNVEKRLTKTWFVIAGVEYQSSRGKSLDGDPRLAVAGYSPDSSLPHDLYDFDSYTVFAGLDYTLGNGWLLSGGYSWTDGYTVASSKSPDLHVYKAAEAVYIDPAWPDLWFAYRLQTRTDDWSLSLSVPVARDASLNLGASWQAIDGPGDRDYDNRAVSIGFIRGF